jgi:hypothetical protein
LDALVVEAMGASSQDVSRRADADDAPFVDDEDVIEVLLEDPLERHDAQIIGADGDQIALA